MIPNGRQKKPHHGLAGLATIFVTLAWLSLVGLLPSSARLRFTRQPDGTPSSEGEPRSVLVTIGLWNDPDSVPVLRRPVTTHARMNGGVL